MHLQTELEKRLPGAELMWQSPLEGIDLQLLASNSALLQLDAQQIGQYWQQLPYWAFAWAAGQGLAQHILLNPELVAGKRVLDFGCGSGIVGIAAAKAGAYTSLHLLLPNLHTFRRWKTYTSLTCKLNLHND